ncbi:MAG: hypothetical protein Aurels2KO_57600 [Aureliella sp.]
MLANSETETPRGLTQPIAVGVQTALVTLSVCVVRAHESYELLLGQDWLRAVHAQADFRHHTYTFGNPSITVKQGRRRLYTMGPSTVDGVASSTDEESLTDEDSASGTDVSSVFYAGLQMVPEAEEQDVMACTALTTWVDKQVDYVERSLLGEVKPVDDVVSVIDINPQLDAATRLQIEEVLQEFSDCFTSDLASMPRTNVAKFVLELKEGAVPWRCGRLRRYAPKELEFMRTHIDALLQAKMIVPATTTTWLAAATVAPKKDEATGSWSKLRFCVDYRKLNSATKADKYPLPRADQLLDDMAGFRFYSAFDCLAGYHSVELEESAVAATAFLTPFGVYVWKVLPFGLTNAPSCYMLFRTSPARPCRQKKPPGQPLEVL